MKNLAPLTLFLFCLFFSCEGYVEGNGYVFNELTGLPVGNVRIANNRGSGIAYSDSSGYFEVGALVGCVSCKGCEQDITASFSADGYRDTSFANPKGDTIFLKPQ
ncbi:MAG: hypothetical protein DYG98_11215 [Haliscomenobacteraceae bacterium CHB4]|nr:hypothetical protein [Saprospiraceae bacterium]MCE7923618.1 hypothetical protein [Haliscomenobacteraceae bacterium CHB4]